MGSKSIRNIIILANPSWENSELINGMIKKEISGYHSHHQSCMRDIMNIFQIQKNSLPIYDVSL